jgi:hypothetical protein
LSFGSVRCSARASSHGAASQVSILIRLIIEQLPRAL